MQRLRLPLIVVLSALLMVSVSVSAHANSDFRFEGKGWGHGIGMTQYGALEQAKDGRSATQIIEHYYRSARVGSPSLGLGRVRVGLAQYQQQLDVIARSANATIRFDNQNITLNAGSKAAFRLRRDGDGTVRCFLSGPTNAKAGTCDARIMPGNGGAVELSTEGGRRYGRGHIDLDATSKAGGKRFHVVADLPNLETYVYGIHEVPSSWPHQALKAQAIAARSYAAYRLLGLSGTQSACSCHVYDSVRDQVYAGLTGDTYAWRKAVNDSAGQMVYAPEQSGTRRGVVQAFYSSSSGGRTENIEDVWRSSAPRPYYSSVKDPWSLRSSNRHRSWTISHSESGLKSQLKSSGATFDDLHSIRVIERNESGSARTVRVTGIRNGSQKTVHLTGDQARSIFKLRSAYIGRVFLPPFVDDDGSRFETDIVWIADQGITKGCNPPTNDHYCPEDPVLRKQMAAFMVRALGLSRTSSGGNFRDVPSGSTFAEDINKLATAGITKGCNPPANDRFCPDQPVLRKQMAAFIVRAQDLTKTSSSGNFRDVPSGSTFAEDINKLATAGITKGCNPPANDRFCPDEAVSRAQMAAFLRRGAPW